MGPVGCVHVPIAKAQISDTRDRSQTKANIEADPLEEEEWKEKGFGENC